MEQLSRFPIYFAGAQLIILAHLPMWFVWRPKNEVRLLALLNIVLLVRAGLIAWPFVSAQAELREASDQRPIRVLYATLADPSADYRELRAVIAAARPDLICISEPQVKAIQALHIPEGYKYRFDTQSNSSQPLMLYSKLRFLDQPQSDLGVGVPPIIYVRLRAHGRPLNFAFYDVPEPRDAKNSRVAWLMMRRISSLLRDATEPVAVIGNMKATPFSMLYRSVIEWTLWRDGQHGFNLASTWNGRSSWQRATLSHLLVNRGVHVSSYEVLGAVESAHLPILADLELQ